MYCEFPQCGRICKNIRARSLVVSWAPIGNEVAWNSHIQNERRMDTVAEIMMINFCDRGHPVFRGTSSSERRDLKSKGKGKSSIYFNGSDECRSGFSHNRFLSISSVFSEQLRICEKS